MMTVTNRHAIPRVVEPHDNTNPLLTLTGLDAELATKRGRIHETVLGFSFATNEYISRREYIITVNPPELPA